MTGMVFEIKVLALVLALMRWAAWIGDGAGDGSVALGLLRVGGVASVLVVEATLVAGGLGAAELEPRGLCFRDQEGTGLVGVVAASAAAVKAGVVPLAEADNEARLDVAGMKAAPGFLEGAQLAQNIPGLEGLGVIAKLDDGVTKAVGDHLVNVVTHRAVVAKLGVRGGLPARETGQARLDLRLVQVIEGEREDELGGLVAGQVGGVVPEEAGRADAACLVLIFVGQRHPGHSNNSQCSHAGTSKTITACAYYAEEKMALRLLLEQHRCTSCILRDFHVASLFHIAFCHDIRSDVDFDGHRHRRDDGILPLP